MSEYAIDKVAITGGSGPVGLALIKYLLKKNIKILLFQRSNGAKKMYLPDDNNLEIVWVELAELKQIKLEKKGYDVFFHLGWTSTKSNMREDTDVQLRNVEYTCDAVELAYELGCHTFIGMGSQAECGRQSGDITPYSTCNPENAYGIAKLSANYFSALKCEQHGIRHIWPRLLSAYGFYDNINSILISNILRALHGEDMQFSKAEQIWDFVFLDDVAEALYLIAKKGKNGICYPISSGEARPLKEYLLILGTELNCVDKMQIGVIPYGPKQIMYLSGNISYLTNDTGWIPKTDFTDGIRHTIEFYRYWDKNIKDHFMKERMKLEGY